MEHTEDCGCKFTFVRDTVTPGSSQLVGPDKISVTRCPMHKAAPALMDGLMACLDALDINAAKNENLFAWQRRDGHAVMRQALGQEAEP